jgi:hypothetical protein
MTDKRPFWWQPDNCQCLFYGMTDQETAAGELVSMKRCQFHAHSSLTDKELFQSQFTGLTDGDLKEANGDV